MTLTRPLVWHKIECKYANWKLIYDFLCDDKVMFAISVTIYKIFTITLRKNHDLIFRMSQELIHDLLYDKNSNICSVTIYELITFEICTTFTWPLEWAKIKCKYANWKPIVMYASSVIIYKMFPIEMCMT